MDVLTGEELHVGLRARESRLTLYTVLLAYGAVVGIAIVRHEPWVDEAQSWLLARDASLADLWTRLLAYEGTPGLWQTLLHLLIKSGLPYRGMNVFSGLLGLAAAWIFLRRAPFPREIRFALPFTFFLGYQYVVIARSYDLLPLLLFVCAAIYSQAETRQVLLTTALSLLAAVSIHGMILSVAAWISVLVTCRKRKQFAVPLVCFVAIASLLAFSGWPARDGTFVSGLNFSFEHFIEVTGRALANAFTGEWISSLLVLGLSIPLLWRGGGWLFFLLAGSMLCAMGSIVYAQVWHYGILFLAWLFALWISWPGQTQQPAQTQQKVASRLSRQLATVSLAIVVAVQGYWTFESLRYDWQYAYSGSLDAARGLKELNLAGKKLYAIGFTCTAIQPYFPRNIFANVNDGRPQAYWDWSRRNHVNQDSLHLAESRPDYVMVGYKNEFEQGVWTDLVLKSGYRAVRHFEGNCFWQTRILEPESYDLYRRSSTP